MSGDRAPVTGMIVPVGTALAYAAFLALFNAAAAWAASSPDLARTLRWIIVDLAAVPGSARSAAGSVLSGALMAVVYVLMLLPAVFLARRSGVAFGEAVGLRRFRVGRATALVAGLVLAAMTASAAYGLTLMSAGIDAPSNTIGIVAGFGGSPLSIAVAFGLVGVVAPFVEEIAFRGVILPGLRSAWGTPIALVSSGLLFGATHLMPLQVLPLSLIGVALGVVFIRSGSLWPAIIAHCAYNGVVLSLAFILPALLG